MNVIKVDGRDYEVVATGIKRHDNDPVYMKVKSEIDVYCNIKGDKVKVKNNNLLEKIYNKWKSKKNEN